MASRAPALGRLPSLGLAGLPVLVPLGTLVLAGATRVFDRAVA